MICDRCFTSYVRRTLNEHGLCPLCDAEEIANPKPTTTEVQPLVDRFQNAGPALGSPLNPVVPFGPPAPIGTPTSPPPLYQQLATCIRRNTALKALCAQAADMLADEELEGRLVRGELIDFIAQLRKAASE